VTIIGDRKCRMCGVSVTIRNVSNALYIRLSCLHILRIYMYIHHRFFSATYIRQLLFTASSSSRWAMYRAGLLNKDPASSSVAFICYERYIVVESLCAFNVAFNLISYFSLFPFLIFLLNFLSQLWSFLAQVRTVDLCVIIQFCAA